MMFVNEIEKWLANRSIFYNLERNVVVGISVPKLDNINARRSCAEVNELLF